MKIHTVYRLGFDLELMLKCPLKKKSKMMVIIVSGCLCHLKKNTKSVPNIGFYFGEKFLIYEILEPENHCFIYKYHTK